jgi:hypothetical protein
MLLRENKHHSLLERKRKLQFLPGTFPFKDDEEGAQEKLYSYVQAVNVKNPRVSRPLWWRMHK